MALAAGCGGGGSGPSTTAKSTPSSTVLPEARSSSLHGLESFHYVASLTLRGDTPQGKPGQVTVSTEGDFQSPDRHAFTYRTELLGVNVSQSAVVIGEQVWLRRDQAAWQQASRTDDAARQLFATAFSPIRPNFLGGSQWETVRDSVRRLAGTPEFVNEVRSLHYQVGPAGEEYFRSFLADQQIFQQVTDLHWDLWLAQDGDWPVRMLASGTVTADLQILADLGLKAPASWELRIDISRPNDPQLAVSAPG